MNLFGFDEQYAMFDVTPVSNQFILEYLPLARGEYVKVYLYGLVGCYHPQEELTLEQMARDLSTTREEILAAYRYWERQGLVHRVSDNPPAFRYVSLAGRLATGAADTVDANYAAFCERLYTEIGDKRQLHGAELSAYWEWVESLHLPQEVVVMALRYLISTSGKGYAMSTAQKLAASMAEAEVTTAEDAEQFFRRRKEIRDGCKRLIHQMGVRGRAPSEPELQMYAKWVDEWGYTPEAIEAALFAETPKGSPNMAYLDGALKGMLERRGKAAKTTEQMKRAGEEEEKRIAPLRALLRVMNIRGVSINEGTLAVYEELRTLYPDEIILMAGRECARHGLGIDEVAQTLRAWKREGLQKPADVQRYIDAVEEENEFVRTLFERWGKRDRPTPADRALTRKWRETMGFTPEMIAACAAYAAGAERPMGYLDSILTRYHAEGVTTPEQAEKLREAWKSKANAAPAAKQVPAQQYTQRAYHNDTSALDALMEGWQEDNHAQ